MSRHRVDGYRAFFRAYPEPGALCAIVRGADGSVVDLEVLDVTAAAVRFMAPFVPPDLGPLASRRLSELAASAEVAGLCAAVGRATDGGETAVELRAPDGRRYVVTVAPVTNDTVALLARDVSDLERSAEALREATERNRAAMLATKDGVVIQDLEGRITSASPAAARMLGLGFDELTGLTSMDPRWQALDAAGAPLSGDRHPAMRTLRTGTPERDVLMNLALPDGRRVLISVSTEPLRDASGGIVGVVSTFSDITDLAMANRQVEVSAELVRETLAGIAARDAQLRNALAELQEARRIAHLGVWRRDERTGEAEWSPEMREMAGLGPDDPLPGVAAVDAAVERQQQARLAALTRSATTGEPWEVEYPWHRPDGGVRWVLSRGMAEVDDDGAVVASHGTVIDITERKEAELALRASEEALRQRTAELEEARRIAGLGVWRADADRAQLHWDAAMHRLTGIVPGDGPLSSEALDRHVEPASIEERVRLIERSIATGEPWQQEYVFHRDDGTDVWLLAHGMAERDAEGRVIGFRGTAQDVTQRKRAELELQATQQQFRRMLDELVEGAVLLDHAWRLRYVNPALTTLPPGAPNPALGMSLFELVPGIGETELFARLARCVAEGVADRFEAQVELPSRPPRWYEVSAQPRPEGLFVLLMDVTERHDAIAAIRDRSEHLSRHAADLEDAGQLAGLGLWRRDLRTRTTTWSPEMFAMFGFDPAAGPPDPATLDAMITPETRAARDHAAAAGVAAGVPWEVELCMRLPDGAVRWILQRGSATLDPDGEIVAYRGTAIDITERKQLEQDLRRFNEALERRVVERTAELEAAVEELRSFSYTVSHDLRAPVRAVAGFARILERDHAEQLDASGLHRLDNIRVAAEAMGRLIDDLLAYTRVGRAAVRRESVHLDPIMARLESTFGARVREAGGSLVISGPMGTPMGDPTLVEEMLVNLVDNAITYRRPDVAPVVAVCASVRGDRVRLAVSDNGRGIPPESQERIFEVFHRLSPSEGDVGTGIGLAIVRKAARSMGAEVAVESVVGEGSTFSVSLPIAPDPEA